MAHQLLFVCQANVCRSPLMEFAFRETEAARPGAADWNLQSRGLSVVRPHRMCTLAASLIEGDGPASHMSTKVSVSDLEAQDLIIVASREERARLARMLPSSRERAFTLKEAVALGAPVMEPRERDRTMRGRTSSGPSLTDFAALLHYRRGRVTIDSRSKGFLPWTKRVDPQDVPDVHHEGAAKHRRTLREVQALVRTLSGRIEDYLTAEA